MAADFSRPSRTAGQMIAGGTTMDGDLLLRNIDAGELDDETWDSAAVEFASLDSVVHVVIDVVSVTGLVDVLVLPSDSAGGSTSYNIFLGRLFVGTAGRNVIQVSRSNLPGNLKEHFIVRLVATGDTMTCSVHIAKQRPALN